MQTSKIFQTISLLEILVQHERMSLHFHRGADRLSLCLHLGMGGILVSPCFHLGKGMTAE